mgnify:FL=1
MNMKNLQTAKADVLVAYKQAKAAYLENMTAENWKKFCERKVDCMRLGVRI